MKKLLPILLVVCTVLLLMFNIFAGSEGGERIAVVAKNTATIDMTDATVKEAVFDQSSNAVTITRESGATATIYAAWDEGAIYFYIDVNDPNLSAFIQKYAASTGKTDKQAASDYQLKVKTGKSGPDAATTEDPLNPGHTVKERTDAEEARGANINSWDIPAVEIMIDPSNKQPSSDTSSCVYQGRVAFDGYNASYVPITDASVCYNMYSTDRFTSVTHLETNSAGEVSGKYQIKMKFTAANIGLTSFEDWQMISVHPFVRFATETGSVESSYASFDDGGNIKNDWDAPNYSYYRLWDPASTEYTGTNASDVASKYTETVITTKPPVTGLVSKTNSSTTSRTPATSSQAPAASTPAPSTAAPAEKGGCGSVIGGVIAAFAATAVAVPVVILRKKDEQ